MPITSLDDTILIWREAEYREPNMDGSKAEEEPYKERKNFG